MLRRGLLGALLIVAAAAPAAAQDKKPPYWASIASGEAMMRTGPGKNYPGIWLYKRRDLPVRVLQDLPQLAADPGPRRHPRLDAGDPAQRPPHRDRQAGRAAADPNPSPNAAPTSAIIAEPGVVGRIEQCRDGWCRIEIGKREGFIRAADIWGVGEGEVVD